MAEYPFKDLLPLDEVLEREGYYRDWTHLDPEVFYSLTQISEYIKTKGFGVDVRLLIAQLAEHFGLKTTQINEIEQLFTDVLKELSEDKDYYSLPEIAGARRGYQTLIESLNNLSFNMFNTNLGKVTPNMVSDELLAQIAGDAAVNAVPADGSITRQKLANNSVSQTEIDGSSIMSPNILDLELLIAGQYLFGRVGITATSKAGSGWNGYFQGIPVTAGDIVRFNLAFQQAYFVGVNDQDLVIQLGPTKSTATYEEIIVKSGVTKFYTAVFDGHLSESMITINQPMPDVYSPFGSMAKKALKWLEVDENNLSADVKDKLNSTSSNEATVSNWVGAKMITAGTSISWQDGRPYSGVGQDAKGWQTNVKSKLGLESVTNIALSGRSMADGTANGTGMITGILARRDYANYDLVVIEEGTNDAKLNVPAGEIKSPGSSDFDRETFCGSMQMGIEHILSHNPNITLVLFTPLHRNNGGLNSYDSVNNVGMKLSDYRDLIFKIGELYSCKVVDLFAESGINLRTLSTDTMDGLHPNDNGYEKMGRVASNGINLA